MKTLFLLLALALPTFGQNIKVAWTGSTTAGCSNFVYASTNNLTAANLAAAQARVYVGTNTTATIQSLVPGQWFLVATAMKGGVESLPSNVLIVEVPAAPGLFRTVVVQFSGTLTNWTDVGFFKLLLP